MYVCIVLYMYCTCTYILYIHTYVHIYVQVVHVCMYIGFYFNIADSNLTREVYWLYKTHKKTL